MTRKIYCGDENLLPSHQFMGVAQQIERPKKNFIIA
jgi:hypothetical protein